MERTMERLSQVLWRERELLEELQYQLEVEQLVLATGRTRWLVRAATGVESVLSDLRKTELMRAVAADHVAEVVGLAPNPSLRELGEHSPEPWGEIFREHREAFTTLTTDITALADSNRELIGSGLRSARETLLALDAATEGYAADGSAVVGAGVAAPTRLDRSF
jgi:hypothetical protein